MSENVNINDRIELPQSPDELYGLITDLDAVAPCVPGAILSPADDEAPADSTRSGEIVFGFGPIRYRYEGSIRIEEARVEDRTVVYQANGTETSGEGTLGVGLTMIIELSDGGGSTLGIAADVAVTGMVADVGQGMVGEIAQDIIGQFGRAVRDVHKEGAPAAAGGSTPESETSRSSAPPRRPRPIGGFRLILRATFRRIARIFKRRDGQEPRASRTP